MDAGFVVWMVYVKQILRHWGFPPSDRDFTIRRKSVSKYHVSYLLISLLVLPIHQSPFIQLAPQPGILMAVNHFGATRKTTKAVRETAPRKDARPKGERTDQFKA
jgi:hypothetical protein